MRLFQIYKEANGKRVFDGRLAATDINEVIAALPPLGKDEKYIEPVECHDAEEYRAAVIEYENKIAREHLPDRRGDLRIIINGLRDTIAAMNSKHK